jgi:hypothetical protein
MCSAPVSRQSTSIRPRSWRRTSLWLTSSVPSAASDRRARAAPDSSSQTRARPCPRLAVHACLLCRVAHAPGARTDPVSG